MPFSKYTALNPKQIVSYFNLSENVLTDGLTLSEYSKQKQKFGINALEQSKTSWIKILLRQLKSSFIYLLVFAAALAFLLGERFDGLMIILFVVVNTALGFYQEYKSEKTIKLLKQYTVPRVKVKRNGVISVVPSTELVPGDFVILETGDIAPADIRILRENDFFVDESILTGESSDVKKTFLTLPSEQNQVFRAQNIVFSETHISAGSAEGIVIAIGKDAEFGKIAKLSTDTFRENIFEKESAKLSRFILKLVLATLVVVFVANLILKGHSANIPELLIFSIALAVSVIPEALPTVITFSLSKGALQLAKHKVVVKRLSSIEDLGGIEILCTDKTGTITENKMTLADVYGVDKKKVLFYGAISETQNSFEKAASDSLSKSEKEIVKKVNIVNKLPFDPVRKRASFIIELKDQYELIIRGAPETMIHADRSLSAERKSELLSWASQKGLNGNRILAVASKILYKADSYSSEDELTNIKVIGLLAFTDPIKKSAQSAIKKAEHLGVQVKILTGDSKEIAGAVAYSVGLSRSTGAVILGEEIDKLNEAELVRACEEYHVFARLSPEQKFKIIKTLEKTYEVGFLGEGINDAPGLKVANVGIVVQEASDIARESADIVLLKKGLDVIVDGIMEGRMVFTNTTKYIKATLASNFGNFYAVAISTLLINYLPMLPIQILLLNLLSDFPMISIADDNVDPDEVKTPPHSNFKEFAFLATTLGFVSTIFDLTFFAIFSRIGAQILQTSWFMGSVLTELVFIYSIRTKQFFLKAKKPSNSIIFLTALAGMATFIIPNTKFGETWFKFIHIGLLNTLLVAGIVAVYFMSTESVKLFYYNSVYRNQQRIKEVQPHKLIKK